MLGGFASRLVLVFFEGLVWFFVVFLEMEVA